MHRKVKEATLLDSDATNKFLSYQIISHQNIGTKGYMHLGCKKSTNVDSTENKVFYP
jgi:hypothetical protein